MKAFNLLFILLLFSTIILAQTNNKFTVPLDKTDNLILIDVLIENLVYKDKNAIKVTKVKEKNYNEIPQTLLLFPDIEFTNGIIELEMAAIPNPKAVESSRGFIGVAFHLNKDNHESYECIYLRPTNGRSEDQLRRNHSVQYVSHPEYPWYRLRKENPGVYESYADLVPGKWTKVKIEVTGETAKLYLHDNQQPCLIVNDLKKGATGGILGLWLHSTTIAYFTNLTVTTKSDK